MYRTGIARSMVYDARATNAGWCYHLHYAALMRDSMEEMRRAHAHFGDEIEPEHEARIAAWVRQRPQNTFGRHVYSAADFGLRTDELRARYADYVGRYGVERENRSDSKTRTGVSSAFADFYSANDTDAIGSKCGHSRQLQ